MDDLKAAAVKGWENAVAGYSGFRVGAGLRAVVNGVEAVFSGCNVENATYGLTVCAERVALFKALSEGAREFRAIVIYTASEEATPPCGACRQLLWEFCGDIPVTACTAGGAEKTWRMAQLLPDAFDGSHLK